MGAAARYGSGRPSIGDGDRILLHFGAVDATWSAGWGDQHDRDDHPRRLIDELNLARIHRRRQ
jgi:hypothetical protein